MTLTNESQTDLSSPQLMAGIRILDFTWGGAGPFATKALADHGAEVIKVETSTHYDFARTMAPFVGGERGVNRSGQFSNRNSSKYAVTLNIKTPDAVDLIKQLIPKCDVIVNNFRAGVLERAGLGYQEAAELRPDVIYVSMPLQGTGGPQANYSGVGHTLNVLSGIYELTAYEDGTVVGPNTNYPDHSVNPGHALVAIMSAIIHRRKTGRGQYIEISQLESTVNLLGPQVLAYSLTRVNPAHEGNTSATKAPYGVFPAAGEDRWIAISVATDAQWASLGAVANDQPWASDSRFASLDGRLGASQELNKLVGEWTRGKDAAVLMTALQERGVPAGVVQNSKDLLEDDPQLAARGHFVTIDHPEMGPTVYNAAPYTFGGTPGGPRFASPLLGEHNELILQGMLGVTDEEMVRMEAADVFK